uniref:Rhodanese-like domain-containing protein n=1 Tax=Eiseniibacteriota bacterium TaxID=2212470 RepID=A0A832MIY2_UNCEI
MADDVRHGDEIGAGLLRGVALIVAVGIGLGIGFNLLQQASGPRRGLAWIKTEVKLASLEDLQAAADSALARTAAAAADREGAPPVPGSVAPTAAAAGDAAGGGEAPTPGRAERAIPREETPAADRPPARAERPADPPAAGPAQGAATPADAAAPADAPRRMDLPFIPDVREPLEVQYATVKKFFDAGAALFVDARSPEEYAEGHIPGAVNLPFDDVFRDPSLARTIDSKGRPVIAYCGGGDCELSRNLAFALIEGGHKKVLVFMGGTAGWTEAGQPLVRGAAPAGRP